jgi:hypothetical protein
MVARKLDGWDHYGTSQLGRKIATILNVPVVASPGRFGGGMITGPNLNSGFTDTIDSQATFIVGMAVRFVGALPSATSVVLGFLDTGTLHTDLRISSGGILTVTRNASLLGTGTAVLVANTWYYIEMKVTINDSTGVAVVKVNNTTDINLSDVDTRNAANSTANQIRVFGVTNNPVTWNVDDYYVFDSTGSVNNDFNGPARVWTGFASEAGNSAQFTGTPGPNFANANDASSDDDGSYNFSSTANHIDSFKFDDPPITSGTATAFQHVITARTDGAGARSLAAHQREGSTNYAEAGQSLSASWAMHRFIRDTNPATSAAITAAELKDDEWGYKLIS